MKPLARHVSNNRNADISKLLEDKDLVRILVKRLNKRMRVRDDDGRTRYVIVKDVILEQVARHAGRGVAKARKALLAFQGKREGPKPKREFIIMKATPSGRLVQVNPRQKTHEL